MVILRVVLPSLLAMVIVHEQALARVNRYVEESLRSEGKAGFRDFVGMVNMDYFRTFYPLPFGVPRWPEFLTQQRAEGLDLQRAASRYRLALHGGLLSEDRIREVLMQDDVYRAHVFAYALLYSMQPDREHDQKEMLAIANASQSVVPLVMAIDANYSLGELLQRSLHIMQHQFDFYPHHSVDKLSNSREVYGHTGSYLMRSRAAEPHDTGEFQATQLIRRGFEPDEIAALSYRARDAIIITAPRSKDEFISDAFVLLGTAAFEPETINAMVADLGPLVFVLTSPPYDYKLDEISKHDIDLLVRIFNFR